MLRKDTWESWEKSVLEIFSMALLELISEKTLPEKEDGLNRMLSVIVRKCKREWCIANNRELQGHPIYHACGQPSSKHRIKQPKENKIPEFTWGFTDYLEEVERDYIVECKRLCQDKYHYCKEYVTSGIKRFVEKEWSYGYGCKSGLMIGYIQEMEFEDILYWVNYYARKHSFAPLTLEGQWQTEDISRLENILDRPRVPVSPFKLVHLWADLR
jgi:hypothetical protein